MSATLEVFGGPSINLRAYRVEKPLCDSPLYGVECMQKEVALVRDLASVDRFLAPRRADVQNPLARIPECRQACARLRKAVQNSERILIYGDYDCDGVTSITLMRDALLALESAKPDLIKWIIPHRLLDGYGLKGSLLNAYFRHHEEEGTPDLLIALDCGSNARAEVEELLNCYIDVIVIDHHEINNDLPKHESVIHINPWLWWKEGKHHRHSAAGLTFFVADCLHQKGGTRWNRERAILLAGLSTCADVVPVLGSNRQLLKHSLSLARDPDKVRLVPGLKQLKDRMTVRHQFDEHVFSHLWGPCINAAGRMGSARDSVELLSATNETEAAALANKCLRTNGWRQATERTILNIAMRQAEAQMRDNRRVLFLCHPEWHPGVIGIAAAKVRDRYNRIVFVSTLYNGGIWKGSARGIPGTDIGNLIQRAKLQGIILEGGGHEMAAGFSFLEARRNDLHDWLEKEFGLSEVSLKMAVETAVPVSSMQPSSWAKFLKPLAPFGKDNTCPSLFVEAAVLKGVRPRAKIDAASQKSVLVAYEGLFQELSTGRHFFAYWRDYELADVLWEVHRFLEDADDEAEGREPVSLGCQFKLELELHGYVTAAEKARSRPDRVEKRYSFVVRQCERVEIESTG